MTHALFRPRKATHLVLLLACVLAAQLAWVTLPMALLSYLSGLASPFCMLCAGAVWAMRDKADVALGGEHLPSADFLRVRQVASAVGMRAQRRSTLVALCGLAAASPAISTQLTGAVWQWMVIVGGLGVGEAAYSYLVSMAWEAELRAHRDSQTAAAKALQERVDLISRVQRGMSAGDAPMSGWSTPPSAELSSSKSH